MQARSLALISVVIPIWILLPPTGGARKSIPPDGRIFTCGRRGRIAAGTR